MIAYFCPISMNVATFDAIYHLVFAVELIMSEIILMYVPTLNFYHPISLIILGSYSEFLL